MLHGTSSFDFPKQRIDFAISIRLNAKPLVFFLFVFAYNKIYLVSGLNCEQNYTFIVMCLGWKFHLLLIEFQ